MSNIGIKEVQELFKKVGERRGNLYLSILKKNNSLIEALTTDVGREILKDSVKRTDHLLLKIVEEKATEEDKAEFRVLKRTLETWAVKVNQYEQTLKNVMEKVNGE